MRNSKLYSVLSQLDKIEQNRFRKYVESPYFNRDETLVLLFELLIREINGEQPLDLEKEAIWEKLELNRSYDDVRFRRYCTDLLKLLEGFLAQQIYDENAVFKKKLLIEAVWKKRYEKLFKSTLRTANHSLEKNEHRNAQYYYAKYDIEKSYFDAAQLELDRSSELDIIENIVKNLDIFFIAEKLRFYSAYISRRNVLSTDTQFPFIEELMQSLDKYGYHSIPAIALHYQIYLLNQDPENLSHYFKLKVLLSKHALQFPQPEALDLYKSALNYCINKINKGHQNFLEELFDLYRDLIEKEIIFTDGEISPWEFRNIVVIACRLGNLEWTENFVLNYNDKLPEAYRENAVSFNKATLYFYRKDYDQVVRLLQTVEYEDPTYNLNSKAMLIATYYETEEIEPLYSLFESFRVFLNRRKDIPENKKRLYKNLIRFTKRLTKIMPGDEKAINKLKKEIEATKNIASVGWLKEKISEFEER